MYSKGVHGRNGETSCVASNDRSAEEREVLETVHLSRLGAEVFLSVLRGRVS